MLRNVIVINDHAAINGGQAKVAIQSAVGLAAAGLNVVFFAGSGPVAEELTTAGVRVECLGQSDIGSNPSRLQAMAQGVWNRTAAHRLRDVLRAFDAADTIVHCHGFAKLLSGAIGAVLTRQPIPVVLTMHEYALACPNGGFFHYPDNRICTRRPLGLSCLSTNCDSRRAAFKAWRIARQIAINGPGNMPRGLTDIISISPTQRRVMQPYLHGARLHHVGNPVDAERRPPAPVATNDAFILIGRLSKEKGCALFAEAAQQAGVPAIFVGEGEERDTIARINPQAVITGWQTPAQVMDWIDRARAVVFSSLWYECQPLVPLEAQARGVPVIVGSWGAAADQIIDDVDGIHLRHPDATALAEVLRDLTGTRAATLGSEGYRRFWQSPPTRDAHVAALLAVYADVRSRRECEPVAR
ncbi:glycosyltransferase family 4 protein [Sphingomonas sp. KR1UV-12]|uniref:Glycosyltransferase family 4 protein n=1 Tax=Sphingomonas aurea TaxID=3063994 RepID=A0ABT9EIS0_9SPHN|nr:glycosyltransferase family 4 protein [Sphingomonas sp. KR1UV-12]MDP1026698.1 glycosyltransferase family 4 protein [Sphingomonas sp. KR1UV-12]